MGLLNLPSVLGLKDYPTHLYACVQNLSLSYDSITPK